MRIVLERDDVAFSTVSCSFGQFRTIVAKVNGKPFCATRTIESYGEKFDREYIKFLDEALIRMLEKAFKNVFEDACSAVPDGVDLLLRPEGS